MDLEWFRERLMSEWKAVRTRLERTLHVARAALDHDPGDDGDRAVEASEQAHLFRAAERDRALLREIDAALARIDRRQFGFCEGTGEPIELARLKARPWARFSRAYLEEREQERRVPVAAGHG
jgi:DnaK suppressor protein